MLRKARASLISDVRPAQQVSGVGVVKHAMNELDRSTQHNATLVKERSHLTEALTGSSSRLLEALGFFRTRA